MRKDTNSQLQLCTSPHKEKPKRKMSFLIITLDLFLLLLFLKMTRISDNYQLDMWYLVGLICSKKSKASLLGMFIRIFLWAHVFQWVPRHSHTEFQNALSLLICPSSPCFLNHVLSAIIVQEVNSCYLMLSKASLGNHDLDSIFWCSFLNGVLERSRFKPDTLLNLGKWLENFSAHTSH